MGLWLSAELFSFTVRFRMDKTGFEFLAASDFILQGWCLSAVPIFLCVG